MQLYHVRLVPM